VADSSAVESLAAHHDTDEFDCGNPELTEWLQRHALPTQLARGARTFVVHRENRVVGYYSLAAGAVEHENATERVKKGLARYPIPVFLLARLAVDKPEQGKGLGAALLKNALLRAEKAADEIGARAILVHAKDERAKGFYERFGFEPSPTDPLHLYLLMKDVAAWVAQIKAEQI
jgi:GNAT superfamily N-acetyltransferase